MQRRNFVLSTAALFALGLHRTALSAPPPNKVASIGWLTAQREASLLPFLPALRAGFADLGYVEGRNLSIESRYGDEKIARVVDMAKDLERLNIDVLIVQGAAVQVVNTMKFSRPVVYIFSGDPVTAGFADSLAKPHANMTGLTLQAPELNGKRLELLRQMMPKLQRVAIIANPGHPGAHIEKGYSEITAKQLGISIDYFPTNNEAELTAALATIAKTTPEAISLLADGFAVQNRKVIIDFATALGIPVISGWQAFAESGALCTYGPRLTESYRRLASYVDRILNGAKIADLPVEQPTRFDLIVNLRAAKALNIAIPQAVLVQADVVIE